MLGLHDASSAACAIQCADPLRTHPVPAKRVHSVMKYHWLSRITFLLKSAILWPIRIVLNRSDSRDALRFQRLGINVFIIPADLEYAALLDEHMKKLDAALQLIGQTESRRLVRMRGDISKILVRKAASSAYLSTSQTVLLTTQLLRLHDEATVAGVLVHEATHARINRWGIRAWPDVLPRIERRCLREQISWLERLSGRSDLVTHYRNWLEKSWWTPQLRIERNTKYFRELGMPDWMLKLYVYMAKPRTRP